jgi:hypothetical protein
MALGELALGELAKGRNDEWAKWLLGEVAIGQNG